MSGGPGPGLAELVEGLDSELEQGRRLRDVLASPVEGRRLVETLLAPVPRAWDLLPAFTAGGRVDLGSVLLEREDGTAHLTLTRDDCLNAEDERQVEDLETAVDLALLDPVTRAAVLRGGVMTHPKYRGRRVFSAGIHLKALHEGGITLIGFLLRRELGPVHKIFRGLLVDGERVVKPWAAAVDTFAIGGGTQLLTVCDHVVLAGDAFLSLPAAQEGIIPGVANLRLTRATGARLARQLLLGGRRLHATDPEVRTLVDEVVAPDAVGGAVSRAAARLAEPAVAVNRMMLHDGEEPLDVFREYMAEFAYRQAERLHADDVLRKAGRFAAGARS